MAGREREREVTEVGLRAEWSEAVIRLGWNAAIAEHEGNQQQQQKQQCEWQIANQHRQSGKQTKRWKRKTERQRLERKSKS